MCTGFVKKGNDLLFGFNLDIDPNLWNFDLYKTDNYFSVGINVGKTIYLTHGVNKYGHFSNLPYMNGDEQGKYQRGKDNERIDLLTDRYIKNIYSYEDVIEILKNKTIVNIPNGSLHTLLANEKGDILLIEPGNGFKKINDEFAVITNYPLLRTLDQYKEYFGIDRYETAKRILSESDDNFSPLDGLLLLKTVKQEGVWATRISFVYSVNEKCVYYVTNNHFDQIEKHYFK